MTETTPAPPAGAPGQVGASPGSPARGAAPDRPGRAVRWGRVLLVAAGVLAVAALQAHSVWAYRGDRVDESELVHFAVGFLGRDLDPGWYGYGSLGMYVLFAVYALLAVPALLFGPFGSLSEYAQLLFSGGYFFGVGRFVFAVLGVLTVVLYADIARRHLRAPALLVGAYVVVAVTSVDAIVYANYIRTDRLVSFFVALTLWAAVRSRDHRWLWVTGAAVAGAIAAKMSALPLAAFVLVLAGYRWRRGHATVEQAALAMLTFVFALMVFQPFVSYPERISGLLLRGSASPFRWGAATYGSMVERMGALGRLLGTYVALALLPLLGLLAARGQRWRHVQRVLLPALLLLALLFLPYLRSPELRSYWFLPVYDLVRFLALAGATVVWTWAAGRDRPPLPRAVAGRPAIKAGVAAVVVLALAAPGLNLYSLRIRAIVATEASNAQLAQAWLEDEVLGRERILLDREFSYHLPKVYDPRSLYTSKVVSRAFIFDRWNHPYLNAVFAEYLVTEYGPRHGLGGEFATVQALRLDPPKDRDRRLAFRDVRLCDTGDVCRPVTGLGLTKDVHVERVEAGDITLRTTGGDPYVVLFDDLAVPVDGSYELRLVTEQPVTMSGSLYLDIGRGFSEELKVNFRSDGAVSVPIRAAGPATDSGRVDILAAAGVAEGELHDRDDGAYFVTSPAVYERFLGLSREGLTAERVEVLDRVERGYDLLLSQPLARRFDEGSGPAIEIYRLGG